MIEFDDSDNHSHQGRGRLGSLGILGEYGVIRIYVNTIHVWRGLRHALVFLGKCCNKAKNE